MKVNKGFTLIELVMVIVILGILSVLAAPRFLNLQTDARNSALQGLKGSMEGAFSLAYGKLAIAGYEKLSYFDFDVEDVFPGCTGNCKFSYGYPVPTEEALSYIVNGIGTDFSVGMFQGTGEKPFVFISSPENMTDSGALVKESCYLKYSMTTIIGDGETISPGEVEFFECK
ncbi:type II secretion system protein [Vibrio sp. 99-70-13A1]|uniref:type II secretion system protein n=1 Tax=Vibrio sp. 99-70-13A1 TaxID=2607601 RepID=UPI001493C19B|nr:type II secretion system protein [Vibrio sp. 99-70-13A1]NOH97545.1 type II secretion system protein [Vibrio sp. 99-70-13A1]